MWWLSRKKIQSGKKVELSGAGTSRVLFARPLSLCPSHPDAPSLVCPPAVHLLLPESMAIAATEQLPSLLHPNCQCSWPPDLISLPPPDHEGWPPCFLSRTPCMCLLLSLHLICFPVWSLFLFLLCLSKSYHPLQFFLDSFIPPWTRWENFRQVTWPPYGRHC